MSNNPLAKFNPVNCRGLYIGPIAVLLYIAAVITGGFLRDGYSHYANAISEFMLAELEPRPILYVLFGLYNLGLVLLGFGPSRSVRSKRIRTTLWLVGVIGLVGGLLLVFPQDPRSAPVTPTGVTHLVLAGVVSLLTLTATVVAGFAFRQVGKLHLARLSWALGALILITGGIAAFGASSSWPSIGLWERLTIGAFLVWLSWFTLQVKWIMYHEII